MNLKANIKVLLLSLLITWGAFTQVSAQKIGYCNIEFVLAQMPETQSMNQTLQTYSKKLSENLEAKNKFAQTKLQAYQAKVENGATEEELKPLMDELVKLDNELKETAADSERKLQTKRIELLGPIQEKLQKEIKALAEENEFTYILNTVDGSGVSLVLKAPEENDVTAKLMERLGIQLPEESK